MVAGLKDIGIREGTFTFLAEVVVMDADCGAVEVGRGFDEAGVGAVACVVVVGASDGPGADNSADVV